LIVGSVLYLHPGVTLRKEKPKTINVVQTENLISQAPIEEKSTATTIPFSKTMSLIMPNYYLGQEMDIKNGLGLFLFQL